MNKEIKIGLIGFGFMGQKHLECYEKIEGVIVAAIVSVKKGIPEALLDKIGDKLYENIDEMIEKEELDAIDICLPTPLHKEAALKALSNGINVIVEKPFALDVDEINEVIKLQNKRGKRVMVAHVCRFMPEYIFAKSMVESGEMGKVLYFGAWRDSETPNWSVNNWLHNKNLSGGTIMDLQIHDIDLSNWLLGTPRQFFAQEIMKPGKEGPSHVISNIQYENGAIATIEGSHLMPVKYPFTTGYKVIFENGVIEFLGRPDEEKQIKIFKEDILEIIDISNLPKMFCDDPYAEELKHFVDCLLTGEEFRVSVDEAKLAVETVKNLIESMNNKVVIRG